MDIHRKAWNAIGDITLWAYHEVGIYNRKPTTSLEQEPVSKAAARLAAADYRQVEKVADISIADFARRFLMTSTPVIVADGSRDWRGGKSWTFHRFSDEFGEMAVQLQGSGFEKGAKVQLSEYLTKIAAMPDVALGEKGMALDYLRYTYGPKLEHLLFTWGFGDRVQTSHFTCAAYQRIRDEWQMPYFLQSSDYRIPWVQAGPLRPNERMCLDWGLYFSAPGASTRLHVDYTRTNAIICQMQGRKSGWLFSPDLEQASRTLSEDATDAAAAADRGQASSFRGERGTIWQFDLEPGEIMLIPKGLAHEVHTLSPSISMTYNFVTNAEYPDYYRLMRERGPGWVSTAPIVSHPSFQSIYRQDEVPVAC